MASLSEMAGEFSSVNQLRNKLGWKLYVEGTPYLSKAYKVVEPRLAKWMERRSVSGYDRSVYGFKGGELEKLTSTNYEKALRNIWKAEVQAPFLGIRDASKLEKAGKEVAQERSQTVELMDVATSDKVKEEFNAAFSPEERRAIGYLMSLIGHGEAYALFTSSKLVSVVNGTGARLGMAMQVMEEAKHFMVLRQMLKFLDIDQELYDSAYLLFERIASAKPYTMMFGMNVMLESFATTLFAQFADYPGLRHIVHVFHMDEARHVGFPKSYSRAGNMPKWVSESKLEQRKRVGLMAPAIPLIFDYKPHFDTLGLDCFGFFGKFLAKASKLADDAGFDMPFEREDFLAQINLLFNSYTAAFDQDRFNGYHDYTMLGENEYRADIMARELEVFGKDVFGVAS